MSVKRERVYKALDSERDYQAKKWNEAAHSPLEFLVYMEDYVSEAKHVCSRNSDAEIGGKVMDIIRKVSALGVACMEQHGAPMRVEHAK